MDRLRSTRLLLRVLHLILRRRFLAPPVQRMYTVLNIFPFYPIICAGVPLEEFAQTVKITAIVNSAIADEDSLLPWLIKLIVIFAEKIVYTAIHVVVASLPASSDFETIRVGVLAKLVQGLCVFLRTVLRCCESANEHRFVEVWIEDTAGVL